MDRSINHALVRQTTAMERSAARTTLAVHQMSAMHSYAASKASTTVTLAHHLVTAATYSGRMTPAKLAQFRQLTEAYLDEMTYITEEVSYQIIRQLAK
jgi:hypothetical protein